MGADTGRRVFVDKQSPAAYKALNALAVEVRSAAETTGLSRMLMELINVRVSQINHCVFCLNLHTRLALEAGDSVQRLALLPAWSESGLFNDKERAALSVAEAVTLVAGQHISDAEYAEAAEHLTHDEISVVIWAAITINAFNRVSVLSGHPVKAEPRQ